MQINPISGPTTHPKNQRSHLNFQGSLKTAQGSDLPPFEAEIVDSVGWTQEDHLLSGEAWTRGEATALFRSYPTGTHSLHLTSTDLDICFLLYRVIEPPGSLVDPETETGVGQSDG